MNEAVGKPVKLGGRTAWIALILMALTQAVSLVDRQILAILAPLIQADLGIGGAELGLLYGTVFAVFYALFSLPLGRLADGWIRTRLLAISIAGWSFMTGLAGFAQNFAMLAFTRLGVGIGEATVQPAGMSLLSDMFPRERRGLISAVMAAGVALGLGAAVWAGGAVAEAWDGWYPDRSGPLGIAGWQAAFIAASIPGFLLAIAVFLLPEPIRGVADGIPPRKDPHVFRESAMVLVAILPGLAWLNLHRIKAPLSAWIINVGGLAAIIAICWAMAMWTIDLRGENVAALNIGDWVIDGNALQWSIVAFGSYVMLSWAQSLQLRDRPSFALLLKTPSMRGIMALATMQQAINYGVMGWTAYYLVTNFDQSLAQVGMMLGVLTATVGIAAPMIGGTLSDVFRRLHPSGRMHLLLVSMSLSPVMAILAFTADSIAMFYVVFVFLSLFTTMWLPMVYATIMDLVLPRMRGIAMSFYILITTILGLGLGPYAVGLMSDITGDLAGSIINLYWTAPIMIALAIFLIWKLPGDERTAIDRARAAGEPV